MIVTIINYGMGNLFSVESAIKYLGHKPVITDDFDIISNSKLIILPGVGSFRKAMKTIKQKKIDIAINMSLKKKSKILGICLGFQLLAKSSPEDGLTNGLNLIDKKITKLKTNEKIKIPHVGFNSVTYPKESILFKNIKNNSDFYFVHSYKINYSKDDLYKISFFTYDKKYIAAYENNNIFVTQFHPEKSQTNGLVLLNNFINLN